MDAVSLSDEELWRNHQTKTTLQITETEDKERAPRFAETLSDLHNEIWEARHLLRDTGETKERLEGQHAWVQRQLTVLNTPITLESFESSPIRRVPIEILVAIFMAVRPHDVERAGRGPIPVLLEVCGEWRAIACAVPELWSSFSRVSIPRVGGPHIKLVELYLERSKAALLTVEVYPEFGRRGLRTVDALIKPMLSLLAAHSERLYCLRLLGEWWMLPPHGFFGGRLSNLKILHLESLGPHSSNEFQLAPRLLTVILRGHTGEALPFGQIRSLHVPVDSVNLFNIKEFSQLTSMTCSLTATWLEGWSDALGHAELPHLACWTIDFTNLNQAPNTIDTSPLKFFDHFSAPALTSLDLTAVCEQRNLGAFIHHSRCELRTLVLRNPSIHITDLLRIFVLPTQFHPPGWNDSDRDHR
ncbi:hypothetical protein C8R46DRAFT_1046844 [Mycena filopes]|nr:hypothetical protein C8R46DRAFT_1046844 [Mycena filopes]